MFTKAVSLLQISLFSSSSASFFLACARSVSHSLTVSSKLQHKKQFSYSTCGKRSRVLCIIYTIVAKMISLMFSLLSLIALSVAQNQTVSLFLPNADPQSLVGSIVGGVRDPDLTLQKMRELTMSLLIRMPPQPPTLFSALMADPTVQQQPPQRQLRTPPLQPPAWATMVVMHAVFQFL